MIEIKVIAGEVAPAGFTCDVTVPSIDMTTVTAVSLEVQKPDGTTTTWTASISTSSTSSLTYLHTFATGEITTAGDYRVVAVLTVPAGTVRAFAVNVNAVSKYTLL